MQRVELDVGPPSSLYELETRKSQEKEVHPHVEPLLCQ